MSIVTIVTVALLVEAIWETLKLVWKDGKANVNTIKLIGVRNVQVRYLFHGFKMEDMQ